MVNVTFNVDMSDESFQTVFIASDFNNWREVEMQPSVDSIYSYTIQLENNTNYEYKFIKLNDGLKLGNQFHHHMQSTINSGTD